MSKTTSFVIALLLALGFAMDGVALAAKPRAARMMVEQPVVSRGGNYGQQLMLDVSAHYVRGTKAEDATDTAGRFSLGGMFNQWIGLDLQGLYETRSKSFLVGADLRLTPTDWFFLKVGMGGYSDKQTRQFTLAPLGGAGIQARLNQDLYLVTETSYFQINKRDNISFGAGLGVYF